MVLKDYIACYGIYHAWEILILKPFVRLFLIIYQQWVKFFFPVNDSVVVFCSSPDYADNARALSDYMVNNGFTDRYKIYWMVNDVKHYTHVYPNSKICFFNQFNKLNEHTMLSIRILSTAGYIMGTHFTILQKKKARYGQKLILLWHGCSFKDATKTDRRGEVFDKVLVAGPLFVKTKMRFWNISENCIIAKGYPRYDWLLANNENAKMLFEKIRKSHENKVVMWMPTFRNDKNNVFNETDEIKDFPLIKNLDTWKNIDKLCQTLKIILVVKLHPKQKEYLIPFDKFTNILQLDNEDFEMANIAMYEFVGLTDALITDYSSIAVDYLVVDKPIAYTLDDFDIYRNARGFVFDDPRGYMPGHHLYSITDLYHFLHDISYGRDDFAEKRKNVRSVAVYNTACYCSEILSTIGINL